MSTKMKMLDCALLSIMASMASMSAASAQEQQPGSTASSDGAMECGGEGCRMGDELVFRLRTRSYEQPVTEGTDAASGDRALQPDRRVSIVQENGAAPGRATTTGRFSIQLPAGGVIWATEDPTLGQPELNLSAPGLVAFENGAIAAPVQFYSRSNYPAFVSRYELLIFRAGDADLVDPLVRLEMPVANVSRLEWDGSLPERYRYRQGDQLAYVLRAHGHDGNIDETQPRLIQLVSAQEADGSGRRLREATEKAYGSALSAEQAQQQRLVDEVFAGNGLRQQNITIRGSRVRIQGRSIPENSALTINGDSYPVDLERKFVAEFLMPVGQHSFNIGVRDSGSDQAGQQEYPLHVDVSGRYLFGVGLADVTVSQNKVWGSTAAMSVQPRYADDIISDGRLAFYGKAKFAGRYLVTAQADTTERDLEHLFDGFGNADPVDIF